MKSTSYDSRFSQKRAVLPMILKDELTNRQRQVIEEYYIQQKSTREIAEKLGITSSAVLRLRHRAEKRIEQCLRYCG